MRGWGALVALALLLSGCLGMGGLETGDEDGRPFLSRAQIEERLTQPVYEEVRRETAVVAGTEGDEISVDVHRPADAEEPVPVILVKTPYRRVGDFVQIANGCSLTDPLGVDPGDCSGALVECGGLDGDGCTYIEWLVDYFVPRGYAVAFSDVRGNNNSGGCSDQSGPKQWQDGYNVVEWLGEQEWSNSRVGMYGASYDGETQIYTALLNPPSLKTIVPSVSVSNIYEHVFYDGVPYSNSGVGTALAYLGVSLIPGEDPNALPRYAERLDCQPEVIAAGLDRSGDWSDFWQERDFRQGAPQIQASVLQTHGLQDWNVKPNQLDGFWNVVTSEKRLILGQWGHDQPQRGDWLFTLHRWYDHYLHGIETGILEDLPPVLLEDSEGRWRGIEAFPPEPSERRVLWPHEDGTLEDAPPVEGSLRLSDHPRRLAGSDLRLADYALERVSQQPSRLVFESPGLEEPLHYTGRPAVHLSAKTDEERTRWVVHLEDVDPDGRSMIINRGYFNTRHIDGLDQPGSLEPGEPYALSVRMFPQDDVIPAGHKLRLMVTNVDDWVDQDTTFATSKVQLGVDGTRLELPLAGQGTPLEEDALRPGL